MGKHLLSSLIVWSIIILAAIYFFSPNTFTKLKDYTYNKVTSLEDNIPENNTEQAINQENITFLNNISYIKLGGILKEVPCVSNEECNVQLESCSRNCTCSDGICIKQVLP